MPGSLIAPGPTRGRSRHRRRPALLLAACTCVLSACSEATVCTADEPLPAVEVTVRDAVTGAPAAMGATGSIRDGDVVHELQMLEPSTGLHLSAYGRPGFYDVLIQKEGYQDWTRPRVQVKAQHRGCNRSMTVHLEARLEPVA